MAHTIVGVYDNFQSAQAALNALVKDGFEIENVRLSPEDETTVARQSALRHEPEGEVRSHGVFGLFHNLFGAPEQDRHTDLYSEAVRRGSFLLTVHTTDEAQSDRVTDILNRYDPIDIDERAANWRAEGWSAYDRTAAPYSESEIAQERSRYGTAASAAASANLTSASPRAETTAETRAIPVIQEELQVGKRQVQRGGVRVFQHVTETPVQETVHLREEHVSVERHPVNQPVEPADLASLKEGSFEVRESAEEAVVAKSARVVEEVVVGKAVSEHDEVISDSVRRSDVEIEQLGAGTVISDSEFRTHWTSQYGSAGGTYEDYAPAYQYGSRMAADERYRNHRFSDVEPDIQRDWVSSHAGHPWEKVKDAVRYGWDKVTR